VGSNTLKEAGFGDLSSATIRNYFAHLEEEGYLSQQHASGGRIPTHKAYRLYANECVEAETHPPDDNVLHDLRNAETHEIAAYLQKAAETLSTVSKNAVFLSSPRFDHDFIVGLKLVPIDHARCLCIMITDFGVIKTEVIPVDSKFSSFAVKRIESYFHWRLTGNDKPTQLDHEEERFAQGVYNEIMVRFIVGYSNFSNEEIYRTGFSQLLNYQEFHDPMTLSSSLALFENAHSMQLLLKECSKMNRLSALGILGPARMPYRELFGMMRAFSASISTTLTKSVYKFKIKFRQPQQGTAYIPSEERPLLLEDKRNEEGVWKV
jgi:heat-inducible transcriptional repressor